MISLNPMVLFGTYVCTYAVAMDGFVITGTYFICHGQNPVPFKQLIYAFH